MQTPVLIRVTAVPVTVQTAEVLDAKLTGRLEEAVAPTLKGAVVKTLAGSAPNVTV